LLRLSLATSSRWTALALSVFLHCVVALLLTLFFFSSRRRHTRFSRDWSSDVCSSDLVAPSTAVGPATAVVGAVAVTVTGAGAPRSEERRVGKGCSSRRVRDGCRKHSRAFSNASWRC